MWQQFIMNLESLDPDIVEDVLTRSGAQAVTLSDADDDPVLEPAPGETPLWARSRITALFPAGTDLAPLEDELIATFGLPSAPAYRVEPLEDRDWEREWQHDFAAMRFGERLWVCPADTSPADESAVIVRLDPGLAFGTGTHATTALCLEWLDALPLAGRTVLDYGCGSGILAIAALKLGAARAVAMDIDVQAVTATRRNAEHNDVLSRLDVIHGAERLDTSFDVVVANILAGPLVDLASSIAARLRPGGQLALSGILGAQADIVRQAYAASVEFDATARCEQGGQTWVRLTGTKRQD